MRSPILLASLILLAFIPQPATAQRVTAQRVMIRAEFGDRINRGQLANFKEYAAGSRQRGRMVEIVAHDRLFRTRPLEAYAESWALSFYLSETQPQRYAAYLSKTAARRAFRNYTAAQRLADFTSVFGKNLELLESQLVRYVKGLK